MAEPRPYIVRHPRTKMFLARKKRPANVPIRAGFGQDYRWVRKVEEAEKFPCYAEAELPGIYLNLAAADICPLLSCGIVGDPVDRDEAMANGTFHRVFAKATGNG